MADDVIQEATIQGYHNLDCATFSMALLFVEIHTNPFMVGESSIATNIVRGIDCVAVPYFYIAPGFSCF